MPIKRSSDQPSKSLEEFYTYLSETSTNHFVDVGTRMLLVVQLINQLFNETVIWGLTSHARLVLQNTDDWKSDWLIIVSSIGTKEYYIEYLIPESQRPWQNAYVRGEASSLEELSKYLLIAMDKSNGWDRNNELKQLLKSNGFFLQ